MEPFNKKDYLYEYTGPMIEGGSGSGFMPTPESRAEEQCLIQEGICNEFRRVPEAEKIINKTYPVLDKGHVILVDYIGHDNRIVESARVSYKGAKTHREDSALINYLMKNKHWSPFEQVQFTFIIKCPIFVARQWFRHRTFKFNEISGRYSKMPNDYYVPDLDRIKTQSKKNKQGSDDTNKLSVEDKMWYQRTIEDDQDAIRDHYQKYLDTDIARELARINLPLAQYTEFYCTGDLRNMFNFLQLRLDSHAQYEIAVYGQVMAEIIKTVVPIAYEAFENHILGAVSFSKDEVEYLKEITVAFERILDLDGLSDKNKIRTIKSIEEKLNK